MATKDATHASELDADRDDFSAHPRTGSAPGFEAADPSLGLATVAAGVTDLLQRSASAHGANAPLRTAALLRTQQTYGNRAVQRSVARIQTKMAISEPGDSLEQEADAVAEQAMTGEECECGGTCEECQATAARKVQTKLSAGAAAHGMQCLVQRDASAASREDEGIDLDTRLAQRAGGGQPLGEGARTFAEERLGHDFGDVRVHTDPEASDLAASIDAEAFTTGSDVYFRDGRHDPESQDGQRLLTHELTHVVQQRSTPRQAQRRPAMNSGPPTRIHVGTIARAIQRVRCALVPAAECAAPIAGSAVAFSATEEAAEAPARERRKRMSPARQVATGHTGRARQLELFLEAEQPGLLANVHGIFIDMDISPNTGALGSPCADMTPPVPAPAGKTCVFVPPHLNRQALQFRQGAATMGGLTREAWRVQTLQGLVHEIQHVVFSAAGLGQAPGVTAADCSRADVDFELGELAAIMSEFPIGFRAIPAGAPAGDPARARLATWFAFKISNPSESVAGALKSMRCKCDCPHVNAFVRQTFDFVSASWTATEKTTFNAELRAPAHGLNWPL
jgi:Domain of unknown function (DUF4157)